MPDNDESTDGSVHKWTRIMEVNTRKNGGKDVKWFLGGDKGGNIGVLLCMVNL